MSIYLFNQTRFFKKNLLAGQTCDNSYGKFFSNFELRNCVSWSTLLAELSVILLVFDDCG
jgi:hypothetical protein